MLSDSNRGQLQKTVTDISLSKRILLLAAIRRAAITTVTAIGRTVLNTVYILEAQTVGTCSSCGY